MIREAIERSYSVFDLNEAYSLIFRSESDLYSIPMAKLAKEFLLFYMKNFNRFSSFKWDEILPITIEEKSSPVTDVKFNFGGDFKKLEGIVSKILKEKRFRGKIITKKNKSSINLIEKETGDKILSLKLGAGSRTRKAGGQSKGAKFEVDLTDDLNELSRNGKKFKHPKIIEEIVSEINKIFKIDLRKINFYAETVGGKNQKRNVKFNGTKFISKPSGDIGEIVTDVDIVTKDRTIPLSLKYTSQFFITNFSVKSYLGDMNQVNPERDKLLRFVGFDPKKWSDGYGVPCLDTNGRLPDNQIIRNLEEMLKEIVGYGYLYIIGGGKKDVVEYMTKDKSIKVLSIIDVGYSNENRKYSFVKFQLKLGDSRYTATLQNRGTTSTDGPNYFRILLTQ